MGNAVSTSFRRSQYSVVQFEAHMHPIISNNHADQDRLTTVIDPEVLLTQVEALEYARYVVVLYGEP